MKDREPRQIVLVTRLERHGYMKQATVLFRLKLSSITGLPTTVDQKSIMLTYNSNQTIQKHFMSNRFRLNLVIYMSRTYGVRTYPGRERRMNGRILTFTFVKEHENKTFSNLISFVVILRL